MTTTKPQETLEPCPLAHPVKEALNVWSSSAGRKWHIWCHDCGLQFEGHLGQSREEVVKAWNTRVPASVAPSFEDLQLQALYEDPHPGYDCAGTCVIHSGRFALSPKPAPPVVDEPSEPSECSCCDHPSGFLPAIPEGGKWLHQGRDSVEPCTAAPRECSHCGKEKTSPECWNCGLFDANAAAATAAPVEQECAWTKIDEDWFKTSCNCESPWTDGPFCTHCGKRVQVANEGAR